MVQEEVPPAPSRAPACFVVAMGDAARVEADRLVLDLRTAGVAAATAFEDRALKAQLRAADRASAAFAAIIGEQELADGTVTLRRLADGVQRTVALKEVVAELGGADDWGES